MTSKSARKHHYVPRFLLDPWRIDGNLYGYYWDGSKQDVCVRKRGVRAFCKELDLLSLETSIVPSDVIESKFFGSVDNLGATVAKELIKNGPTGLSADERSNFGRLLLSLDARRPVNVAAIKEKGVQHFKRELDHDPELLEAFKREGIDKKPSEFLAYITHTSLSDRALLMIQKLVDNPKVGTVLINAHWRVYHLGSGDGSYVLSDRPLLRTEGYDHPETVWALPLSPKALFVASNSLSVIQNFDRQTPLQLRKHMNQSSLNQVDRYVFMIDESNLPLVSKRLRDGKGSGTFN